MIGILIDNIMTISELHKVKILAQTKLSVWKISRQIKHKNEEKNVKQPKICINVEKYDKMPKNVQKHPKIF